MMIRSFFVTVMIFLLSCSAGTAQNRPVRFEITWLPQAQFAGVLVAEHKGFFTKKLPNNRIEITYPHVSEHVLDKLSTGTVDFCMAWLPDALLFRCVCEKIRPVCLLQIQQNTQMMLVTRTGSGIEKPSDIDGKQVQVWRDDIGFMMRTFFKQIGVKPVLVPQNESMLPFIYNMVPVASALYFNEYHQLLERGLTEEELRTFRLNDFGLDFPSDGIYCKEELWKNKPELCRGIIRAVTEGWMFAADPANEEETLKIVMNYVKKTGNVTSRSHQLWMLRTMRSDLHTDSKPWGQLRRTDFDRISHIIKKSDELQPEQVKNLPAFEEFFMTDD